jgi:hypothetical protein
MKRWLVLGGAACVAAAAMAISAAATTNVIAYNNIPTPTPGNVSSVGGEAYAFSEFGGQVHLSTSKAHDATVTVLMSSWGCQSGSWNTNDCTTAPGSTFPEPITLNIYSVRSGNAVGSLIATETQNFSIPYRPSYDSTNCTNGKWFDSADSTCYNGLATPITFNKITGGLPTNVIVSVAYNTSHYGYAPYGEHTACYTGSGGCGYDSLNVGLADTPPTKGSDPTPNAIYQNSSIGGEYCDGGTGGTGTFRLDDGCWAPYQPAFQIGVVTNPLCHVPAIIGDTPAEAKAAIKAADCTVGRVTLIRTTQGNSPHYVVTSQRPKPGTTLQQPGYVSFTAKG